MNFEKFKKIINIMTIYFLFSISLSMLIRIPSKNIFFVFILSSLISLFFLRIILKNIYVKQIYNNWKLSRIDLTYIIVISIFNFLIIYLFSNIHNNSTYKESYAYSYYSFITVLVLVVLGPLIEELVFRGLIFQLFTNKYIYMIISSSLFCLIHATENIFIALGIFFSGILLSFSYIKTKNILIPIFVHSINNIIAIFLN